MRLVARWLPSQAAEPLKEYSLHSGDHNTMPLRKKIGNPSEMFNNGTVKPTKYEQRLQIHLYSVHGI